eukprot:1372016-Rhodomonas_salina.1
MQYAVSSRTGSSRPHYATFLSGTDGGYAATRCGAQSCPPTAPKQYTVLALRYDATRRLIPVPSTSTGTSTGTSTETRLWCYQLRKAAVKARPPAVRYYSPVSQPVSFVLRSDTATSNYCTTVRRLETVLQ